MKLFLLLYLLTCCAALGQTLGNAVLGNATLGGASSGASSLLTGIAAYWKCDETSGDLADSVGASTLADFNTPNYTNGVVGNAAMLVAASTMYFKCADNAALSLETGATSFTWSMWLSKRTTGDTSYLLSKFYNTESAEYVILDDVNNARLLLKLYDGASHSATIYAEYGSVTALNGLWHHVVWRYDSVAQELSLYTNGVAASAPVSYTYGTTNGVGTLSLGALWSDEGGTASAPFDGDIDEVGFWKRVLTTDEISTLYNSGNGKAHPFN